MADLPLCRKCNERPEGRGGNLCSPCNTADHKDRRLRGKLATRQGGALGAAVTAVPINPEAPVTPMRALVKTTTKEILGKLDDLAARLLNSIDEGTIDKAGLRDRMIAFGVVIDKRQLLSGQPTQILSIDERKSLNALVPALLREARRRGIAPIEATAVDVTPSSA